VLKKNFWYNIYIETEIKLMEGYFMEYTLHAGRRGEMALVGVYNTLNEATTALNAWKDDIFEDDDTSIAWDKIGADYFGVPLTSVSLLRCFNDMTDEEEALIQEMYNEYFNLNYEYKIIRRPINRDAEERIIRRPHQGGKVTIPKKLLQELGIEEDTPVEFVLNGKEVIMKRYEVE
jgi:hypothetical protein